METGKNDATVLLRLPADLKAALQRQATVHGRRITSEINMRLRASLGESAEPRTAAELPKFAALDTLEDPLEPNPYPTQLPENDRALIEAFHRLPAEKQLALLSLLR